MYWRAENREKTTKTNTNPEENSELSPEKTPEDMHRSSFRLLKSMS